jgi:tRNA(Ile)-lysidine synthetase-like protein
MNLTQPAVVKRHQATVRRYMLDHGMPELGRILVAVSGGADSTALLLLLHRLAKTMRTELHVAHFDHGLRGRAAAREESFVRSLCDALCVPCTSGSADVRETARTARIGLEDAARRERYAFLARVAAEAGCSAVATGHTASDQAETVLLHLIRGTGLKGLGGMQPVSSWPFEGHRGLRLVRPLLRLSRQDTLAVCAAFAIEPLEDESNASPRFRRNRIRHEVLPLLREMNPSIELALVRLASAASEGSAYLESEARKLFVSPRSGASGDVALPRELKNAPVVLRQMAVRMALADAAGDAREFTERHFEAVEGLLMSGATGDRVELPRGVVAVLEADGLVVGRGGDPHPSPLPGGEGTVLGAPGACSRFGMLEASLIEVKPESGTWVEVDEGAVKGVVRVRRRRDGDRFQPLGMSGTKKLQDFFVDARVPRDERDAVPIFESGRGIVWVGGLRIADWAKPQAGAPTLFLWYEPVTD